MSHPQASAVRDLTLALPASVLRTLHHLLTCRPCRQRTAEGLTSAPARSRPLESSAVPLPPDEADAEQLRRLLARRDPGGEALLAELLGLPPEEASRRIEEDRELRTWSLASRLLLSGAEALSRDVEKAARRARLAAAIAERLEIGEVSSTLRAELLVRAAASLGAARRLAGRLEEAEAVLVRVARHLPEVEDPSERAAWCRGLGLLRRDQERPDEALALLARSAALFAQASHPAEAATASVEEAWVLLDESEPERAAALLEPALERLDAAMQPGATIRAWQGLARAHADLRDPAAARRALREAHLRLLDLEDTSPLRARLLWQEGRLAAELGESEEAKMTLATVREELERAGLPYEAVQAGLDLARLLAEEGRVADLAPLATELGRLAASLPPEPVAAVASFQHAVAQGRATLETVDRIAEYLRRARRDRGLRFADSPAEDTPTRRLGPPARRPAGSKEARA